MSITYSVEDQPLGTDGTVRQAAESLRDSFLCSISVKTSFLYFKYTLFPLRDDSRIPSAMTALR